MTRVATQLWRGDLPLAHVVWRHAVAYAFLVNVVLDIPFYALIINKAPALWIVLAFLAPMPYNIFVIVAVWRSAAKYSGAQKWADLARIGSLVWIALLTIV